jgi:hypothetical protein
MQKNSYCETKMPWKLIRIRKSGRKPVNGNKCKVCNQDISEQAWSNRNKHRSKYVCKLCFPKLWI